MAPLLLRIWIIVGNCVVGLGAELRDLPYTLCIIFSVSVQILIYGVRVYSHFLTRCLRPFSWAFMKMLKLKIYNEAVLVSVPYALPWSPILLNSMLGLCWYGGVGC